MAAVADPQISIDERVIESKSLEDTLELREKRKEERGAANAAFKEANDSAKALIGEFDLQDGEIARIGRFRIAMKRVAPKSVSFETDPSTRLQISLIERDG